MAKRMGRTFTVSFPAELADEVEQMAGRESRTISELFREAFRTYRAQQIRAAFADQRLKSQASGGKGYRQKDLERLVEEDRGGLVSE
jgi:predicted transcriptional regulator